MSRPSLLRAPSLRVVVLLLATVLAATMLLLVSSSPASADAADAADALVLAVEGEPLGPEPMPRTAEDNPARELAGYEDLETPFTWGAAWLLTFLGVGGLATMALVYFRAVERPVRTDTKAGARR
jgi:hypothetical protein